MHCAGELDTDNRGDGVSKVYAAAQDGVGGSTPEFDDSGKNSVGISTPCSTRASELYATLAGGAIQARSTRD